MRRYGSAAVIGGAFIVAIGVFLRSTAYAELAGQAIATGGVILVVGVVLLAAGTLLAR